MEMTAPRRSGGLIDEPTVGTWDSAVALREAWPHCGAFLTRALSLDPSERPPDARTFHRQLDYALRADDALTERPAARAS